MLSPSGGAMPTTARSPEQEKAEAAAVKQAFDYIDQGLYDEARELMESLLSENKTNAAAVHAPGYTELSDGQ